MKNSEIKIENGITTIALIGRIDTVTSATVEADINAVTLTDTVVVDAAQLEYISSSGLRLILKLVKMCKNMKMINVSPEVYEIFEVTGFSDIINIER